MPFGVFEDLDSEDEDADSQELKSASTENEDDEAKELHKVLAGVVKK